MLLQQTRQGKKSRIGRVVFTDTKMRFLAGYEQCTKCQTSHKILLDIDEARMFAKCFSESRRPLGLRIAQKIVRFYE